MAGTGRRVSVGLVGTTILRRPAIAAGVLATLALLGVGLVLDRRQFGDAGWTADPNGPLPPRPAGPLEYTATRWWILAAAVVGVGVLLAACGRRPGRRLDRPLARRLVAAGALVAVACGATGLYAVHQPAGYSCLARSELRPGDPFYVLVPGDPGYRAPTGTTRAERASILEADRAFNALGGPCVEVVDAPATMLRSGAAGGWWIAGLAVLVLALAAAPAAVRPPR